MAKTIESCGGLKPKYVIKKPKTSPKKKSKSKRK